MTSNIGSSYLLKNIDGGEIDTNTKENVLNEMKLRFKPEFLNRLDDIILFKTLSLDEIEKIIDIFLENMNEKLLERDIKITVSHEAKMLMAKEGYDPIYGARPLQRYIEGHLYLFLFLCRNQRTLIFLVQRGYHIQPDLLGG